MLHSQYLGESFNKFTFHFCVANVINKDFSDIVFGSQTSRNIVKIRKQASKNNFYTCMASTNGNMRKNKRKWIFLLIFIILILCFGHLFSVIFRCLKSGILKKKKKKKKNKEKKRKEKKRKEKKRKEKKRKEKKRKEKRKEKKKRKK